MAQRIYLVSNNGQQRLIRAASQALARNHVAKSTITVSVATTDDVFQLATQGATVEETFANAQLEINEAQELRTA